MSTNLTRRPDPLEDFFRGFFVRPVDFGGHPLANVSTDAPQMRVDVKEKADAYEVHAELPGMKKEDIHVHIDGPVVSISAERKQEKEIKDGEKVLRTERYFGKVSRSFQLGQEIDGPPRARSSTTACSSCTCPRRPRCRPGGSPSSKRPAPDPPSFAPAGAPT